MKRLIIPLLAIPLTFLIVHVKAATPHDTSQHLDSAVVELAMPKVSAQEASQATAKDETATIAEQEPKPAQTAPKPPRWAVSTSPHGAVTIDEINTALQVYQDKGMPKLAAAYLVGNFIGESHLKPCDSVRGDGGAAWGLAQWHPGRRADMPCDYVAQLHWAVDVEMQRDSPASRATLFDPNAGIGDIQQALKNWERWGTLGARWVYAADVYAQIQAQ